MSQSEAALRKHGLGWNLDFFVDKHKLDTCLCSSCNCVCCDTVELGCDHGDNEILLYCSKCLTQLIILNNNKCPINSHKNPIITPSRATRRQILKSMVHCPYSIQQNQPQKMQRAKSVAQIVDTFGNDEAEGNQYENIAVYQQQIYGNGQLQMRLSEKQCNWMGSLDDLINKHMKICMHNNNQSSLKAKHHQLQSQILSLQNELKVHISEKEGYKQNLKHFKMKIQQQDELIMNQNNMIDELRLENLNLKEITATSTDYTENKEKPKNTWHTLIQNMQTKIDKLEMKLSIQATTIQTITAENQSMKALLNDKCKSTDLMDEKKMEHANWDIDTDFIFGVEAGERKNFGTIMDHSITYKGSNFGKGRCTFGPSLSYKNGQKFTVYFNIVTVGSASNYHFGFCAKLSKKWNIPLKNAMMIRGNGVVTVNDGFCVWNELNGQVILSAMQKLFDINLKTNTIVMNIDMTNRKCLIWNKNDIQRQFEMILPEENVRIVLIFGGNDDKTVHAFVK